MIDGVKIDKLNPYHDSRGHFFENFRAEQYPQMVQGNVSFSYAGVLRGMHYHKKQADLWTVMSGQMLIGLFDKRLDSPTAFQSYMIDTAGTLTQIYIPSGVVHGFYAVKDVTLIYMVDQYYDGSDEHGIKWNDPALKLDWPRLNPILSERDQQNKLLVDVLKQELTTA